MTSLQPDQLRELESLYRSAHEGRVRVRALAVLLAAEEHRNVAEIARIIRHHQETVRRWLHRYLQRGIEGLQDAPRPGAPTKATPQYRAELRRALEHHPHELGLPYDHWTARHLADHLEARTGLKLSEASIYRLLRQHSPQDF
ncbi:helix-turn-helix domain-containing protein [Deinococcus sonorensis]|uniref:Helix-turn-helix domain-containing protein n=2 Tax=Deinococcus sonorensis TaxID=309891 RepID=A0AAU7U474_9DEIO